MLEPASHAGQHAKQYCSSSSAAEHCHSCRQPQRSMHMLPTQPAVLHPVRLEGRQPAQSSAACGDAVQHDRSAALSCTSLAAQQGDWQLCTFLNLLGLSPAVHATIGSQRAFSNNTALPRKHASVSSSDLLRKQAEAVPCLPTGCFRGGAPDCCFIWSLEPIQVHVIIVLRLGRRCRRCSPATPGWWWQGRIVRRPCCTGRRDSLQQDAGRHHGDPKL